jgi:hypothetical protein
MQLHFKFGSLIAKPNPIEYTKGKRSKDSGSRIENQDFIEVRVLFEEEN